MYSLPSQSIQTNTRTYTYVETAMEPNCHRCDEKLLMDMYFRYPIVEIILSAQSAQSVIRKFNKIFSMFGYPKKVLSDNGPPFESDVLKLYFEFLNIKHR